MVEKQKAKIIIFGPPGSGKGTISNELIKENYSHISTGDIFRELMKEDSDLANKIKFYVNQGKLVPDEINNEIIQIKLTKLLNDNQSFILDGYPRNIVQANFLDTLTNIDLVINLVVNDNAILVKRIIGRRSCPKCFANYNVYFNPPKVLEICDNDQTKLFKRADDTTEVITKRIEIYNNNVEDVLNYYSKKNIISIVNSENEFEKTMKKIYNLCGIQK